MELDEPLAINTELTTAIESFGSQTSDANELRESISTPPLLDRNTAAADLPNVTPGSEPWHTNFPTQWLPVITRDIELQRNDKVSQIMSNFYSTNI